MWFTKIAVSSLLILISCQITKAASYAFTILNLSGNSQAEGINDKDQVVGFYYNYGGPNYSYLYSSGSYTTINAPGSIDTRAIGINNLGQISGFTVAGDGTARGFLDNNGIFNSFYVPGTAYTTAFGINNTGQIVGSYKDPNANQYHGYLRYSDGTYTTLNLPGSASGLNDKGQIVSSFNNGDITQNYLYDNGSYVTLPDIPGFYAYGINDSGQIVGNSGVLNPDGSFTPISIPGYLQTSVYGINNLGQLVGTALDTQYMYVSFIATPTPEPRSFLPIAVAFAIFRLTRTLRPRQDRYSEPGTGRALL